MVIREEDIFIPADQKSAGRLNALIVDDEEPFRKHLQALLADHYQINVVGQASTVEDAIALCHQLQPDLIFLDIILNQGSGFELLTALILLPRIIFVTSYSDYAVRAFELGAVDYLTKPIYPERLSRAIDRISTLTGKASEDHEITLRQHDVFLLPAKNGFRVIATRQITSIHAERNFSIVHLDTGEKTLVYRTLLQWQSALPPRHFERLDRSLIINVSHLSKIIIQSRDSAELHFCGKAEPVSIARVALKKLKEITKFGMN